MELVISLNPAVDVEWRVETVRWEEKNQVLSERRWPGGKGINVARWLARLGGRPRLVIPLGGANGEEIANGLSREGISCSQIHLREPTRANVVVTTKAGKQLRFNPLGPAVSPSEWRGVFDTVAKEVSAANLMIISGALPRGVPINAYAQLLRLANDSGVRSIVDCDGEALKAAVTQKPFLVKPNEFEVEQWLGKPIRSQTALVRAARNLSEVTSGWVLVSRGPRGALLVGHGGETLVNPAPGVQVRNTIGAGDALVAAAALEIEKQSSPADWLRRGVAAGSAATECEAGKLPSLSRIRALSSNAS
jgi:1-phosphofructokinase family hexose kinase